MHDGDELESSWAPWQNIEESETRLAGVLRNLDLMSDELDLESEVTCLGIRREEALSGWWKSAWPHCVPRVQD